MGSVPCHNIAAWNPTAGWRARRRARRRRPPRCCRATECSTSGSFRNAGGVPCQAIARWANGAWESLPAVTQDPGVWVSAYSAGIGAGWSPVAMESRAGSPCSAPTAQWHPLGSDSANRRCPSSSGPSMFAGGYFSEAGGEPAYGIAEWDDDLTAAPIPVPTLGPRLSPAPNPFALIVDLRYELAAPAHARIEIFDIAGHMVERVFDAQSGCRSTTRRRGSRRRATSRRASTSRGSSGCREPRGPRGACALIPSAGTRQLGSAMDSGRVCGMSRRLERESWYGGSRFKSPPRIPWPVREVMPIRSLCPFLS